jgi:hypothetical protein
LDFAQSQSAPPPPQPQQIEDKDRTDVLGIIKSFLSGGYAYQSAVRCANVIYEYRIKPLQAELTALKSQSVNPPLKEQIEAEEEDDLELTDDDDCPACGGFKGAHMKGCPEDRSPFAELIRNGYD